MPHKHVSSSAALKASVALLREGIGPGVSKAFVLAPLWAPGVGCVGLVTIADIPYSSSLTESGRRGVRRRKNGYHRAANSGGTNCVRHGSRQHAGEGFRRGERFKNNATADSEEEGGPHIRYAVGAGVVDFARRAGVALGAAIFRLRNQALIASVKREGGEYGIRGGKSHGGSRGSKKELPLRSSPLLLTRQSSPILRGGKQQRAARRGVPAPRGAR